MLSKALTNNIWLKGEDVGPHFWPLLKLNLWLEMRVLVPQWACWIGPVPAGCPGQSRLCRARYGAQTRPPSPARLTAENIAARRASHRQPSLQWTRHLASTHGGSERQKEGISVYSALAHHRNAHLPRSSYLSQSSGKVVDPVQTEETNTGL